MKFTIFVVCLVAAVLAEDQKYKDIGENFDISEVLGNPRLLMSYGKCLLNQGPCTPEIKQVKEKLPEALETRCAKCTEKQKQMGKQLAREVKKHHPDLWKNLVAMYDPQGKHQQAFQDFLAAQ